MKMGSLGLSMLMILSCQDAPVDDVQLGYPTRLMLNVLDASSISVTWVDNSTGEVGYHLERKGASGYESITILEENSTAYVDTSAEYAVFNHYRISVLGHDSLNTQDSIAFVYFNTEWSTIPGGMYHYGDMGTVQNDLDKDFDMMTYEVTNSQFVTFLNEAMQLGTITVPGSLPIGVYEGDEHWPAADRMAADVNDPDTRMRWTGDEFVVLSGYENRPVSEVPWFGAYFFARHYGLALPTEREWEKAARGSADDPYPWGSDAISCEYANAAGCGARLIDVGLTTGASPFGVRDMIGNVWEWTDDFWELGNPRRVLRGGSCNSTTHTTYVFSRNHDDAWHTSYFYGFRCIKRG